MQKIDTKAALLVGVMLAFTALAYRTYSDSKSSSVQVKQAYATTQVALKQNHPQALGGVNQFSAQELLIGGTINAGPSGVVYDADFDRGWFDVQLNDLPQLTDARFTLLGGLNGVAGTMFAARPPAEQVSAGSTMSVTANTLANSKIGSGATVRVYAILGAQVTNSTQLLVTDSNGVTICTATGNAVQDAICDTTIDIPLPADGNFQTYTYRAYAANAGNVGDNLDLKLAVLDNSVQLQGSISGPAIAPANSSVKFRYTHNLRLVDRFTTVAQIAKIYSSPGVLVREVPIFASWNGSDANGFHILNVPNSDGTPSATFSNSFGDRSIVNRTIVDIPVNATSVTFTARRVNLANSRIPTNFPTDIDLYVTQTPGAIDQASIPLADLSNAFSSTTAISSTNSSETLTLSGSQLSPGRWYVVGKSKNGDAMGMSVRATFNTFSAPPNFKFGHYYNPNRPGHGVYLDKGSNQWVMLWYTYLEDGTPTWYIAQAPAPSATLGSSKWEAEVRRVVWNGNNVIDYYVGFVDVTLLGDNSFQFTHLINGVAGSEKFVRLADGGGCNTASGNTLDISGLWYSPSKSGFGYSIEHFGNQEFVAAYMYDATGMPRWLVGQKNYVDGTSTIPMNQNTGFCPTCAYRPTTSNPIGTMTRTLTQNTLPDGLPGFGDIGVAANYLSPLMGAWNESRQVSLLTSRKSCQ